VLLDLAEDCAILEFANRAQLLAGVWLEHDPSQRLPAVWSVLQTVPTGRPVEQRVVLACIIHRIVAAFHASHELDLSLTDRARRLRAQDVHATRALEYILTNYAARGLSLETTATDTNISSPHLSRLLKTVTGFGFQFHVRAIRLMHAARLVSTTSVRVSEAADRSGYAEAANLDHEFRRWLHMTPGEFRRWTAW
jgi:AraC-like DNA-binding protein